jgi:hypothetical protein
MLSYSDFVSGITALRDPIVGSQTSFAGIVITAGVFGAICFFFGVGVCSHVHFFFLFCFSFFPLFSLFLSFFSCLFPDSAYIFFPGFSARILPVCNGFSRILNLFCTDFLRGFCPFVTDFPGFYICSVRIFCEDFARL